MKVPILDRNFIPHEPFTGTSLHNSPKLLQWVDAKKYPKDAREILKNKTIPLFVTDSYLLQNDSYLLQNIRLDNSIKRIAWLV